MKVTLNLNSDNKRKSNTTFGFKFSKDEHGFRTFETSYIFDPKNQDCYLEIFALDKDFYNNYKIAGKLKNRLGADAIKMGPTTNKINLLKDYGITPDTPFAYHYKVINHNNKSEIISIDAGDNISERDYNGDSIPYNIVLPNGTNLSKGGNMKLVIVDSQNVGVVYNKDGSYRQDTELTKRGLNAVKTLTNVLGGTVAGLEKDIDEGRYDNYTRIISLPVFTRDDFSAHKYWIEDIFQPCNSVMNINNYASLQKKMFAHGMNFVSDGAFVNEGLQGVHFSNVLKWGTDSPYYRWFRAENLKNAPLSLGVFPRNTEYVSHKVVNSPKLYYQTDNGKIKSKNNPYYESTKPTYIQFFDKRLVSPEERDDPRYLIKTYSKMNTENVYDIHTHDDSVFPYAFEINPETYQRNINHFNDSGIGKKITYDSYEAARILSKNENFVVDGKFESGFETWDANPDIAKLNFVMSFTDLKNLKNLKKDDAIKEEELLRRAHAQVQDYTVEGGKYWTKLTNDILRMHIAQNIKDIDTENPKKVYDDIIAHSDNKLFPKSLRVELSQNEVINVLEGNYHFDKKFSKEDKNAQVLEHLMNFPLESIEFGTNLVGVLSSPLVTKRASVEEEIGVPRYNIYKKGNPNLPLEYVKTYTEMDRIYSQPMRSFAMEVLNEVNQSLPEKSKIFDGDRVTEYGQYVLPLVVPQIAKFSVIKALAPNIDVNVNDKTGEISYDYNELLQTHLESLNIPKGGSVEDETMIVLNKLKDGLSMISDEDTSLLTNSILKSIDGTSTESFKLADLIIDKTQSGLDWRIDATKDIADVESLRSHNQPFEDIWDDVINFWKKFNKAILKENPNSYVVAEVTNDDELYEMAYGSSSPKYKGKPDILQKFLRETGITSTANYTQYFYNVVKLFSKSFQNSETLHEFENTNELSQKLLEFMISGNEKAMFKSFSLPAIMYSYSFIGNHDKPRALHCAALDMDIFYIPDFSGASDIQKRQAYKLLTDTWDDSNFDNDRFSHYNFHAVSPKAVAMGLLLRKSFVDAMNEFRNQLPEDQFNRNYEAISKSVADLSAGKFKDTYFDPDSFGVKPIDFNISKVIENAKAKYHYDLPEHLDKQLEDVTFEKALQPAMSKILAMMKVLVALPGMPTLYDGDDLGATGYDTETKNMYLQGRQRVHNEWAQEGSPYKKQFIADFYKKMNDVMALRKKPECNALNNGSPFVLPMQVGDNGYGEKHNVPAVIQKSPDGRMTISLFNIHRLTDGQRFCYDNQHPYNHKKLYLDAIRLNFDKNGHMCAGEWGVGIHGIKAGTKFINANNENDIYEVKEHDGKYFIKKENDGGIELDDTTLVLYSVPENTPLTFTSQYNIKQNLNTIMNTYKQKQPECGSKLSVVCK